MSWFSGKKFRRVRCENFDEFLSSKNASEQVIHLLKDTPPVLSFLRLDEVTFRFTLEYEGEHRCFTFKIGQEHEVERMDGSKIILIYNLEGDNIVKQTVKMPDGKTAYFIREFSETETKMTVQLEGSDVKAAIYYEIVE
ncbi:unnamed protein product, partial [Iphiclides podalirius]